MITTKFKRLRKGLKNWSKNLSDPKSTIANTNAVIMLLDTIEEYRSLGPEEKEGRDILKEHRENILHCQKLYFKQRATIRSIKFGGANTKFFQAKATIKHRNNHIAMHRDESGSEVHSHQAKVAILYRAFHARLGQSSSTANPLLLHTLLHSIDHLQELELPFTHA